ncbi:hypothetical protein E2C01_050052 [Portunus trituberculatus]|uniref:Uncharacterized protein n=1 Tax=Portunus trituberculatus TaxID=210409 RepID=A0A5B7G789_PORTR|nr:hypothetical protein [Portunus trituberculatus]
MRCKWTTSSEACGHQGKEGPAASSFPWAPDRTRQPPPSPVRRPKPSRPSTALGRKLVSRPQDTMNI